MSNFCSHKSCKAIPINHCNDCQLKMAHLSGGSLYVAGTNTSGKLSTCVANTTNDCVVKLHLEETMDVVLVGTAMAHIVFKTSQGIIYGLGSNEWVISFFIFVEANKLVMKM